MFTFIDAARVLLAVATGSLVIALPGVPLAWAFGLPRRDSLVVGLATLPLLDSMAVRFLGLDAALAATLVLAACGAVVLVRDRRRPAEMPWQALALGLAWLAIVLFEWVDLDVAGRLYQAFTVIDTVKHAATTQAILDTGAPPRDPFFLRAQPVSYYYFFYTLPALAARLGFGLVDARAAMGGAVFWVGLGLYGLVRLAMARAGFAARRPSRMLVIAILAASGLDIVGVLRMGFLQGTWLDDPAFWNEQTTGWFESLIWVPHHVTGLIAGMLGLMALAALAAPSDARSRIDRVRGIGLAAICFASALGLSIWLTLALVTTAALWGMLLLVERRWHVLGPMALAGVLAMLLAAPQLHDLVAGRAPGGPAPIVVTVRAFSPIDGLFAPGPWRLVARFLALPLNYFAGFGILASGAILFWRMRAGGAGRLPEFGRVLVLAAIAGLVLGAVLKSTLFNNDLGWRVMLFPLLAGTVWTIAALERVAPAAAPPWRRIPAFLLVLLGLGWGTTAYALVSLRAYPWIANQPDFAFMSADPATERDVRVAYAWADRALPPGAVLQHDPTRPRAFAFALYGSHPTAVADHYGSLFGADPKLVAARIAALAPLFEDALPAAEVRATARANGIDAIVLTAQDPVWSHPDAALMRAKPAYVSARVRIVTVAALADVPAIQAHEATPAGEAQL